jgi:hypothetical protein
VKVDVVGHLTGRSAGPPPFGGATIPRTRDGEKIGVDPDSDSVACDFSSTYNQASSIPLISAVFGEGPKEPRQ